MKIIISLVTCVVFIFNNSSAQSWFNNFLRHKTNIGYERLSITENFLFGANKVPNREASLTLSSFGLGFGVYLPVYEFAQNFSVGLTPHVGFIAGGISQTSWNDPTYGNTNSTGDNSLSIAAFKFQGTVDFKYGGDAIIRQGSPKYGFGIGFGYVYDLFIGLLKNDYETPVMKAEAVYLFRDYFGIGLNTVLPFKSKIMLDNFSVYGYSVSVSIIGSWSYFSEGRRR